MYFTMTTHVEDGKTYSRRTGRMTLSFKQASKQAIKKHGYIVDEAGAIIAQAMNPDMPKYIGSIINVASGEDSYVDC